MNRNVTRCIAGLLWVLATAVAAGEAAAHGGLAMEKDYCKLRIGRYIMHFTGYQPGDGYRQEFCEDIPSTGATIIILDFIDEELRDLPVSVRIIRDTGGGHEHGLDEATVFYILPKVYPKGTFSFDYQFKQPGNFVGLVTVGDGVQQTVGMFPFSVGAPRFMRYLYPGLIVIVFAVVLGLWYWRRTARVAAAA